MLLQHPARASRSGVCVADHLAYHADHLVAQQPRAFLYRFILLYGKAQAMLTRMLAYSMYEVVGTPLSRGVLQDIQAGWPTPMTQLHDHGRQAAACSVSCIVRICMAAASICDYCLEESKAIRQCHTST